MRRSDVVALDDSFRAFLGSVMVEQMGHHQAVERFTSRMTIAGKANVCPLIKVAFYPLPGSSQRMFKIVR
jgi:hypothetical protein